MYERKIPIQDLRKGFLAKHEKCIMHINIPQENTGTNELYSYIAMHQIPSVMT